MMALQQSSVRRSGHVILFNTNVGIFSELYAIMPPFLVSELFIDPYFILNFNVLGCLVFLAIACNYAMTIV